VLYGKSVYTVANDCGISTKEAAELLGMHRRTFKQFWIWSNWMTNEALATRKITTKFGWCRHLLAKKDRDAHKADEERVKKIGNSLQNWPMQSHGAEMLRLACIYAAEMRLGVCAPLHDAIFAVAKIADEKAAVRDLKACMDRASIDLIGAAVPIEFSIVRYPDRFIPSKKPMAITVWAKMLAALEVAEYEAAHPKPVEPKPAVFCQYKFSIEDMPSEFDTPILHQIGDVCGVEASEDCKWCEDHCKKPETCAVHKPLAIEYTGGTR
jgi:hypothetical protein